VPYDETQPSPDGHFYRCHTVGRDYDEDGNPNSICGTASADASSRPRSRCKRKGVLNLSNYPDSVRRQARRRAAKLERAAGNAAGLDRAAGRGVNQIK
jgi:hypothetical protein